MSCPAPEGKVFDKIISIDVAHIEQYEDMIKEAKRMKDLNELMACKGVIVHSTIMRVIYKDKEKDQSNENKIENSNA